nr:2-dehydropantoate 2-reductase [Candidatus Sigynarchaeota archaeon]
MKVCIVGAGSLGSLLAAYLVKGGVTVGVLTRGPQAAAGKSCAVEVRRVFSNDSFHVENITNLGNMKEISDYDLIFLAVKAFDVLSVVKKMHDDNIIDPARHVMCLIQNGLGIEDSVRFYFPRVPILRASTTNGALLEQPGVVKHTGSGETFLGFWDAEKHAGWETMLDALRDSLVSAGLHAELASNMRQKVWEKAIVNAGINPVGAIFKVPNGRILEIGSLKSISDKLVGEAMAVARKGKFIEKFDGFSAVKKVIEATAANRNSMLQDIEKGRKTEIDFINGAISRAGIELHITTPWNDALVAIIHGLEATCGV